MIRRQRMHLVFIRVSSIDLTNFYEIHRRVNVLEGTLKYLNLLTHTVAKSIRIQILDVNHIRNCFFEQNM
jgi:hypothetical protein